MPEPFRVGAVYYLTVTDDDGDIVRHFDLKFWYEGTRVVNVTIGETALGAEAAQKFKECLETTD